MFKEKFTFKDIEYGEIRVFRRQIATTLVFYTRETIL
jgi:hypothetical protein